MKEPIYKAKTLKDGKWYEGNYFQLQDMHYLEASIHCLAYNPMWNFTDGGITEDCDYFVIDYNTLCEYIGWEDCKGNKIYTNDILTIKLEYDSPTREYPPDYEYVRGIVKFDEDNLQYVIHFAPEVGNDCDDMYPLSEYNECEICVVGNSYDE